MPSVTVKCSQCGAAILAATAARTGGLCLPCKQGRPNPARRGTSDFISTAGRPESAPALMPSPFSLLRQVSLWGDYGDVLISGSASRDASTGQLRLHRGGPFVPPVSFPWDSLSGHAWVVTESFRRVLEQAALGPMTFRPVIKAHIVPLEFDWTQWDRTLDVPPVRPRDGEPEAYLTHTQHSPALAAAMPDLWEVLPPILPCKIEEESQANLSGSRRYFRPASGTTCPALFRNRETWFDLIVDPTAREWLEAHADQWVRFEPLWQT